MRAMSNSPSAPRSGFARMFLVTGLPTELKVSFWIWFVGGILGLLGGMLGMLASLVLFAAALELSRLCVFGKVSPMSVIVAWLLVASVLALPAVAHAKQAEIAQGTDAWWRRMQDELLGPARGALSDDERMAAERQGTATGFDRIVAELLAGAGPWLAS